MCIKEPKNLCGHKIVNTMFRCVYIYLYIYISNHIRVLRTCNNFSTCISAALNLFSVRIGVYVMSLYSIELAFIMNCICPCIVLFLLLFILNCMRERERGGVEVEGHVWRSVAPIAVPFLLIHCCQVAHSTRAHVLLSKQISLELLNKLRWLGNLMDKHFACLL